MRSLLTRSPADLPRTLGELLARRFDLFGLLVGLNLFWASLIPSLMPRVWYWQGLISGILVIIGYGAGVLLGRILRAFVRWRPSRRTGHWIGWTLLTAVLAANLYWLVVHVIWQASVYPVSGFAEPDDGLGAVTLRTVLMVFMTVAVAWTILSLLRLLAHAVVVLHRFLLDRRVIRRLPPLAAQVVTVTVIALVGVLLVDTGVRPVAAGLMDGFYTAQNERDSGFTQPDDPLRSGSDASLVSWDSLGWPGQTFVSGGPDIDEIQRYNPGRPAKDPIRVYVGRRFSTNIPEQARIAVKELERTGAFDRAALQVVVVTGTGWVDTKSARPLEYLYDGDIATVSMQYSYLPSALSFLFDRDRVAQTARALVTAVHDAAIAHEQATGHRPRLYLYAQSLGAYGTEQAFPDLDELTDQMDAVLFAGTPGISPLHTELTARREQEQCLVDGGRSVLFVERPDDVTGCADTPRLVYLQNPSDPVVKWQRSLLWRQPDWIAAEQARGLLTPYFAWTPGVTWLQVTLDMLISQWAPATYGHNYGSSAVPVWERLTGIDWDDARTQELMDTVE